MSEGDKELFLQAIAGATPFTDRSSAPIKTPHITKQVVDIPTIYDDGGQRQLRREFLSLTAIKKRKKSCQNPVSLDLHGLTRKEIRIPVRDLISGATAHQFLLIIHGRGLGSTNAPVLREELFSLLAQPGLWKHLDFAVSAPSHLGGSGATLLQTRGAQ